MKSWKKPTPEQVNKAVALLARSEQNRYFFDRLENPEWILPLREKGVFSFPPQLVKDEEGIRMVPWPTSQYLARMARRSSKPSTIMDVILSIPETENVRVRTDLVEAALGLPGNIAACLVPKAINWIETPYNILLHDKLGDLIGHLAGHGEVDKALDLARELLVVLPRRDGAEEGDRNETHVLPEPQIRIQLTDYESIIEANQGILAAKAGLQVVDLFSGFLEIALKHSIGRKNEEAYQDLSHIWRPAIEDHEQNHDRGIRDILVSAIRDISQLIAADRPNELAVLLSLFERRKWGIFRRLALHLMRLFPETLTETIKTHLTDQEVFQDHVLRHEYALLLREQFGNLDAESRKTILNWIEQGPDDLEKRIQIWKRETGATPSAQDVERYKNSWQLKQLTLISESLPEDWENRYKVLSEQLKAPEHPEFEMYSRSGSGPNSPRSANELAALSPDELRDYLIRWVPEKDDFGFAPSREGLGRELSSVVAQDPQRYLSHATSYFGLDPTYIRSILQGVAEGLNKGHPVNWEHVLDLSAWVMTQERMIPGRNVERWEADPDWGWTRKKIADLLDSGFGDNNNPIPQNLRPRVWDVLASLTDDPNPGEEDEGDFDSGQAEGNDLQHAINSVRGSALEGVVGYALWVRRSIETAPDAKTQLQRGLGNMPEVQAVLDAHLDLNRDPSPAIRAIFGMWFPWLVLLDPTWAGQVLTKIFPVENPRLWQAAWGAYILFRPPYDNVLEVMMPVYKIAASKVGTETRKDRRHSRAEEHLAQHLMTFYWRGRLALEGTDGILQVFYQQASDSLLGEAIEFIGQSLKNTSGSLEAKIVDRTTSLWEWRLSQAQKPPSAHQRELAQFGWWFGSGKFENRWAMQQLLTVLKLTHRVEADFLVMERLAELTEDLTQEVLECSRMMIEGDKQGWDIQGWEKELRHILGVAVKSRIPETHAAAVGIINRLGERGYLTFRDLLRDV